MAFSLIRLKSLLLGLAASSILLAQVDPKLLTPTDLLDVYKSGGVKPEMITILDFSGSMHAVFWHKDYFTDWNQSIHSRTPTGRYTDYPGVVPYLNTTSKTVSFRYNASGYEDSGSSGTYMSMLGGKLIKPDGTYVDTSTGTALSWVQQATHVEITATHPTTGVKRTLHIPLPWALFKTTSTDALGNVTPMTSLVVDTINDPGAGTDVAFDSLYTNTYNILQTGSNPANKIGRFHYNYDYLYWLFFGTQKKGPTGDDESGGSGSFKDDAGGGGTYVIPRPSEGGVAFANGIPAGTRYQFLKAALLKTWYANQDKLWWAYRFLDGNNEEEGKSTINSANFTGTQRKLALFKKSSAGTVHSSVTAIQSKEPSTSTPFNYALANAYAQMVLNDSGSSVFDFSSTGENPSPCRTSWVVLFTDGNANDSTPAGSWDSTSGGGWTTLGQVKAIPFSGLNPDGGYFNVWSLSAVAAHANPVAGQTTTGSAAPSAFAPFRVKSRGSAGTDGRYITTLTVGLSLAGTGSDTSGGKGPLIKTAGYGDPKTHKDKLSTDVIFDPTNWVADGVSVTGKTPVNFFDATDPTSLSASLGKIISRITQADTSITAPAAPLVGLNLGNRAYLGRFGSSNDGQGSIWKGDLLMAGLGIQPDGTVGLKDKTGTFQLDINESNAVASASAMLKIKGWKNRNVFTVVPGTAIPFGGLDLTAADQSFSDQNSKLTPKVMGVGTPQEALSLIRFIRGASRDAQNDTSNPTTIVTSRTDLMGDIINSSPAAVEYDPSLIPSGSLLAGKWATYAAMKDPRFQVIFVGDNQGHFHAFGEVSGIDGAGVLKADIDELWSFIPPELLNNPSVATTVSKLGLLKTSGNDHIYTVDGSPYIYFKDKPLPGSPTGNRRVDSADTVRVIIGMRKGGRSYYAFDVLNPGAPKLAWMLDPSNSADPAIKTMGLATSTPAVARVEMGSPAVEKDVVFLGGGYSNNELDALTIGTNPGPAKLGRSLLALNVEDGSILKVYDFVNNGSLAVGFPTMGAISAGAFPLEFYVGSRKTQRVYFGDQSGGVYALGSMQTLSTQPVGWRLDSSNMDQWTTDGSMNISQTPANAGIRWIYKGQTTLASGKVTEASPVSSTPVAYRVPKAIPQFMRPSSATNAPNMIPPVVAVTFGTGDRNDPMDLDPIGPVANAPYRHVMVFDRQDSADLPTIGDVNGAGNAITDALLSDQTSTSVPGDTSYLGVNQKLGYFLRFHAPTTDPLSSKPLFEKSYLNPLVTNGGLIFSAFKPGKTGSTVVCEGAGVTHTYRMCDALVPVFGNGDVATTGSTDKQLAGCNGFVFTWTNLAGDLTAIGSRMVLQSGQDTPSGTSSSGNVKIQDLVVQGGTQSFAPRAWRIIR
ncbi:MAG: hypothetical protein H6P99_1734 [Holophagaceae bacterium]|nr:hypothetical protein [Holophagaceae bacterium]